MHIQSLLKTVCSLPFTRWLFCLHGATSHPLSIIGCIIGCVVKRGQRALNNFSYNFLGSKMYDNFGICNKSKEITNSNKSKEITNVLKWIRQSYSYPNKSYDNFDTSFPRWLTKLKFGKRSLRITQPPEWSKLLLQRFEPTNNNGLWQVGVVRKKREALPLTRQRREGERETALPSWKVACSD